MSNQSFMAGGAIDLGALAAQRQNAEKAAASLANAPEGVVIDVTEATFQAEVIERSMTVPVIIDLWAEWCQPCKQLSPVLERLVAEAGGRLVLAKIDIDAEQRIAAAFRVQSIPAVFAVVGGQPLPLFQGALPESQVKAYLAELLKAAEQAGVTGRVGDAAPEAVEEEPLDPRFDAAADAIDRGDWDAASAAFESILAETPGDEDAQAGLAQVRLLARTEGLDAEAALARVAADPADVEAAELAADALVITGDVAGALAVLVEAVRLNAGAERDRARQRLLELFEIVGPDHPAVAPARVALANALF